MKKLIVVSELYPFGLSEVFVGREISVLSSFFDEITIFPQNSSAQVRSFPHPNITLDTTLAKARVVRPVYSQVLFSSFYLVGNVFFTELFRSKRPFFVLCCSRFLLYKILKILFLSREFLKAQGKQQTNSCYYSIWMDDGALMLALLKDQKKIPNFFIRLHGFDLFDERREGNYMPFRAYIFKHATKISVQTKEAYDYLIKKGLYPEKIEIHRQGVFDCGINPFDLILPLKIVSCSNLYKSKRVDLLIEAFANVTIPVDWIHFGDGPEYAALVEQAKQLPSNIQWKFAGRVPNESILEHYKDHPVHLFILLSETEGGVPVVLQEAASFGIPLLGNAVGGIPEIVNKETGFLLDKNCTADEISHFLNQYPESRFMSSSFREGVRGYWQANFEAVRNYTELYHGLFKDA